MHRAWRRLWLFAGHSCEAAQVGEHFLFEPGKESLIVVRDEQGDLRALPSGRTIASAGTVTSAIPNTSERTTTRPATQTRLGPSSQLELRRCRLRVSRSTTPRSGWRRSLYRIAGGRLTGQRACQDS